MNSSTRIADFAMLTLSVILGVGSVVMFVMLPSVHYLPMRWPDSFVLPWDALLSLAFFAQHSGMVRRSAHVRLAAVIPTRYQRAAYAIASGIVLALVRAALPRARRSRQVTTGDSDSGACPTIRRGNLTRGRTSDESVP